MRDAILTHIAGNDYDAVPFLMDVPDTIARLIKGMDKPIYVNFVMDVYVKFTTNEEIIDNDYGTIIQIVDNSTDVDQLVQDAIDYMVNLADNIVGGYPSYYEIRNIDIHAQENREM